MDGYAGLPMLVVWHAQRDGLLAQPHSLLVGFVGRPCEHVNSLDAYRAARTHPHRVGECNGIDREPLPGLPPKGRGLSSLLYLHKVLQPGHLDAHLVAIDAARVVAVIDTHGDDILCIPLDEPAVGLHLIVAPGIVGHAVAVFIAGHRAGLTDEHAVQVGLVAVVNLRDMEGHGIFHDSLIEQRTGNDHTHTVPRIVVWVADALIGP